MVKLISLFFVLFVGCATSVKKQTEELGVEHKDLIVMYSTTWCQICKDTRPLLEEAAKEINVKFVEIKLDEIVSEEDTEEQFIKKIELFVPFVPMVSVYVEGLLFYQGPVDEIILAPFTTR